MDQQIRFCTSADGVCIAYAVLEQGARTVIYVSGFPAHLEVEWERPSSRALLETLAAGSTLVRYDLRGCGLSDTGVTDFSIEALVRDLEAVVEACGAERFVLLSMGMLGGPTAIAYAAAHPDRVSHLVLCSAYARGDRLADPEKQRAMIGYTEKFGFPVMDYVESADPGAGMDRTGRDMVHLAPPQTQAELLRTLFSADVSPLLPRLTMSTTVLHGRGDKLIPFAEGRALAAGLPNAEFVPLEGNTGSALTERDSTIPAIRRALSMDPMRQTPAAGMRAVLFTDLVGHAEMMQRLGDAKGREVLREHERITRDVLRQHGGAEVKTMGDGFLASFGSVTSAMECAVALQRAFAEPVGGGSVKIDVRIGLNAGEPIEEDGDLFGATVILASRIAAQAGAGEILVPDTVRGLLAGKGFVFADRGEFVPKGFDDATRLFEVRWRE